MAEKPDAAAGVVYPERDRPQPVQENRAARVHHPVDLSVQLFTDSEVRPRRQHDWYRGETSRSERRRCRKPIESHGISASPDTSAMNDPIEQPARKSNRVNRMEKGKI